MGGDSKITVQAGSSLELNNCLLESCKDIMWQGIDLGEKGVLALTDCEVKDAMSAVTATERAHFELTNTKFSNNLVGVSFSHTYLSDGYITGCTFDNPAMNLKGNYHGSRTQAGIMTEDVWDWRIGESDYDPLFTNTFRGISCGIYSHNSGVTVYNNYFEGIKKYNIGNCSGSVPTLLCGGYPYWGWGVYGKSDFGVTNPGYLNVVTSNNNADDMGSGNINFNDCDGGINASNNDLVAFSNNISNCFTGVRIAGSAGRNNNVFNNGILQTVHGVVTNNNSTCITHIHENNIANSWSYNTYPPSIVFTFGSVGVGVSEISPNTYTIWGNTISGSHTGIRAINTSGVTNIGPNWIDLSDPLSSYNRRIGISIDHCNGASVYENTVLGNGGYWQGGLTGNNVITNPVLWTPNRRIGIFENASKLVQLHCNNLGFSAAFGAPPSDQQDAVGLGRAMCFRQDCNPDDDETLIRENAMSNSFVDVYLERLGPKNAYIGNNIGNQTTLDAGNKFGETVSGLHTYRFIDPNINYPPADIPIFWYLPNTPWQNRYNDCNVPAYAIFKQTADLSASLSNNCSVVLNYNGLVPNGGDGGNGGGGNLWRDVQIALDMTNYSDYENFLKANEKRELYGNLKKNPSYRGSLSVFEEFYTDYEQTSSKKLFDFDMHLKQRDATDTLLDARLDSVRNQIKAKAEEAKNYKTVYKQAKENGDSILMDSIKTIVKGIQAEMETEMLQLALLSRFEGDTAKEKMVMDMQRFKQEYGEIRQVMEDSTQYLDSTSLAIYQGQLDAIADSFMTVVVPLSAAINNETTIDSTAYSQLMQDEQELQSIAANENYEQNEKQLDEIIVQSETQGLDSISMEQWNWIGQLAHSCPLAEGYSVYTARALYEYVNYNIYYDDLELCQQVGFFKTDEEEPLKTQRKEEASLWYDTRGNTALVKYDFLPDVAGEVQIYDVLGQPMATGQLQSNAKLGLLRLPEIASGEYIYKIKARDGYTNTGRFIITH